MRTLANIAALGLAGILAGALATGAALAEPVAGTWQTEPGDDGAFAHVKIAPCGDKVCGVLSKAFDAAGQPVTSSAVGRQMIWDMQAQGDGTYTGGRIWAPDRDRVYRSKMELAGDRLTVSGCVGPVCRGQTWRRVN